MKTLTKFPSLRAVNIVWQVAFFDIDVIVIEHKPIGAKFLCYFAVEKFIE